MTQPEYEKAKAECWKQFYKQHAFELRNLINKAAFLTAFDRAYGLGKQFGNSEQVDVEKAAEKFADEIRIPASIPGVMVPFINGLAHDAYLQGAQDFIGKQESKQESKQETVISGWVARDEDGSLFIYSTNPERIETMWMGKAANFDLRNYLFPDLTWESEPEPVEIIIKRKKK